MSGAASLVLFFVGFILTATGVQATCPIELSPPRVVVRYGDPVSVNCSASVSQHKGMGWEAKQGGISLAMVNHLTWTLKNLTEWTISPICFINLLNWTQCIKTLNIVLYTFPDNISIHSSSNSDGVMRENEQYNLTCHIHQVAPVTYLNVTVYKGDRPERKFSFKDTTKTPVDKPSVYTFTPTRRDNGVTFRCEATMDLGPEGPQLNVSSQEINITVHYGPEVQCSVINILEGETLESKCPVEGNPTPSVRWMKDGKLMNPSHPLTRENAGRYIVEAQGAANFTKNITVLVMYGPELKCPGSYTAMEHSPLNLNCTVEGYPVSEITWYKDGENLTRSDAGLHVITASNHRSRVNVTVEINVMYPPSLKDSEVELKDSEVKFGNDTFLKCSSSGNPRPTYIWNYFHAANVKEENKDGDSILVIHNATGYNTGSYTCLASNKGGHVSKTVRLTVKGAMTPCPIEITPHRMVIPYRGSNQTAVCNVTSAGTGNVNEIYWVVHGNKIDSRSWSPNDSEDWDPRPVCTATFPGLGTCNKTADFTLYKTPDSVSIRPVHNVTSVVDGAELQLQCDVISVAPARNLTVHWYQGNDTLLPLRGRMRVARCQFENVTKCNISEVRYLVDVSSTISITVGRKHNGVEFRCEAQMDLGLEGPQPPPKMRSEPLNITVHYKPAINTTKLPKKIPVFRGYPEELVCEADGHPRPNIKWISSSSSYKEGPKGTLTVYDAGLYNCTATNEIASDFYEVEVILKEDYLPLIAGFVAVTVVAISIVFLFIYSIYYKNTRMRRYSLKNPRLSTHNGNVAHNGWDMQFPMTKLS